MAAKRVSKKVHDNGDHLPGGWDLREDIEFTSISRPEEPIGIVNKAFVEAARDYDRNWGDRPRESEDPPEDYVTDSGIGSRANNSPVDDLEKRRPPPLPSRPIPDRDYPDVAFKEPAKEKSARFSELHTNKNVYDTRITQVPNGKAMPVADYDTLPAEEIVRELPAITKSHEHDKPRTAKFAEPQKLQDDIEEGQNTAATRKADHNSHNWDPFRVQPVEEIDEEHVCVDAMKKVFKVLAYIFLFLLVLAGSVFSKGALLIMASNSRLSIKYNCSDTPLNECPVIAHNVDVTPVFNTSDIVRRNLTRYVTSTPVTTTPLPPNITASANSTTQTPQEPVEHVYGIAYTGVIEQCHTVSVRWIWALVMAICVPYVFIFLRSFWRIVFKTKQSPNTTTFIFVMTVETLHSFGLVLLIFHLWRHLDSLQALALLGGVSFIPSFLSIFYRPKRETLGTVKMVVSILSTIMQASALVLWPVLSVTLKDKEAFGKIKDMWAVPVSLLLISLSWWENFVSTKYTKLGQFGEFLGRIKKNARRSRSKMYAILSLWKIACTIGGMMGVIQYDMGANGLGFGNWFVFGNHRTSETCRGLEQGGHNAATEDIPDMVWVWAAVWAVQLTASLLTYFATKSAAKLLMQEVCVTFPMLISTPITIMLLVLGCENWQNNPGFLHPFLPRNVFLMCSQYNFTTPNPNFAWVITSLLIWWISQLWVTHHMWFPKAERLAKTEKLFVLPFFCGAMIDQSLTQNRRKDERNFAPEDTKTLDVVMDEMGLDADDAAINEQEAFMRFDSIKMRKDATPMLYLCATMWHENETEMVHLLKSIFRLDIDQNARKNAQTYLDIVDPDFYKFEAHIFFDDAFEFHVGPGEDYVVNEFVKLLVQTIDVAASGVHNVKLKLPAPHKFPTPYGGKLEWRMPGGNKIICHLKDKTKIRHKKRWSQVMYMYYFLGQRLWSEIDGTRRKQTVAENTYLLALDGDVDFQPLAVLLLVDLMKRNDKVGAACGRIHPIGSGPMVWYQRFEYAVGHWFQKSTEHVIGCVLCSPGCFSLFRGSALMDTNVMKRYTTVSTEPTEYVQFDQGEDRWLCTLLLQQGYRVEYSAASDALTFAPEGFNEFFNQRRRWSPSTMANIMDLISSAKVTTKANDSISWPYIIYQAALFISSILGPSTVFLVIVGALDNLMVGIDNSIWIAFSLNLAILIIFMILCLTTKTDTQLFMAGIMSAAYALIMILVMVSVLINIRTDGLCNTSSIFMITLISIFITTGLLHPQEVTCLIHGLLYYLAVPSTFMLLMIFSLSNLNNVSWGTREVKKTKTEQAEIDAKKQAHEAKTAGPALAIPGVKIANGIDCCGLFKIVPPGKDQPPQPVTIPITHATEKETNVDDDDQSPSTMMAEPEPDLRDDMVDPHWIEDNDLGDGAVVEIPPRDVKFFNELIEKYLKPLENDKVHQEKVAMGLKELRNKVVFGFFILNAIYITVVFTLQLQGSRGIAFSLPCNLPKIVPEQKDIITIQPIAFVFLLFFGLILILQFLGMLVHRYETFMHIMSTTFIECCSPLVSRARASDNKHSSTIKQALQTAKDLSALQPDDDTISVMSEAPIMDDERPEAKNAHSHFKSAAQAVQITTAKKKKVPTATLR